MPSRPEHLWSDPVVPSSTNCGLDEVWSSEDPQGFAWHHSFCGSMPLEDAVDGSTSQANATSNSTLPHTLTGKCKYFLAYTNRVGRCICRTFSENWEWNMQLLCLPTLPSIPLMSNGPPYPITQVAGCLLPGSAYYASKSIINSHG